jgi:hypothetical protein
MHAQYFDRSGRQLDEHEALEDGVLKSGVVMRTRMMARDSKMPRFTNEDYALHRPGFRSNSNDTPLDFALTRDAKIDAYAAHRDYLENSWRHPAKLGDAAGDDDDTDAQVPCAECYGRGENDGVECFRCGGDGYINVATAMSHNSRRNERENNNDRRTVQQKMRDHKANMDRIYSDYSRELSEAWRKG